ncbi:MAG: type V CRISPR-associated protein Cas12a/Cpf1, partial [Eubacteriales bacterium]
MEGIYSKFTNKYAVSKTLRFELVPQGRTTEYIENKRVGSEVSILEEDMQRAEDYKKVKLIIDSYHKELIKEALQDIELNHLEEFELLYKNKKKNSNEEKEFKKCQENLRKQIAEKLKNHKNFSELFSKELFSKILPQFVDTEEDLNLVESFNKFTTYFKGYHKNRKNMYSHEDKSTAIAYRIIHQNLPMFLDNLQIFSKCSNSDVAMKFAKMENELAQLLEGGSLDEVFRIEYFSKIVTQQGIDRYNQILGGFEDGVHKQYQGLNQYINLHNQIVDKSDRIGQMKTLYKQVLSDRESLSFVLDDFQTDQEVLDAIYSFVNEQHDVVKTMMKLCTSINQYDWKRIYVKNGEEITKISQVLFKEWGKITEAISEQYDREYTGKKKINTQKYEEEKVKKLKAITYYTLEELNKLLQSKNENSSISNYYQETEVFRKYEETVSVLEPILQCEYSTEHRLAQDKEVVPKIKAYLDSAKEIQRFMKPFLCDITISDKEEVFYGKLENVLAQYEVITLLYNKTRNYMSKKPYSQEKIKLNFGNQYLLKGWEEKLERKRGCLLFRDNQYYYLGIVDVKNKKEFEEYPMIQEDDEVIYKLKYTQISKSARLLATLFEIDGETVRRTKHLDELRNEYLPKEINRIRNLESYKTGENFSKEDLVAYIDYYKKQIAEYKDFDFIFKESKEYEDFGKFTDHINQQAYQVTFEPVLKSYIDQLVEEGKLYFFKIYNKDFSEYSKGTPNLHTLYWKMLFDERNLKNPIYKLNGEAEIFYRKASITAKDQVIHKANEEVENKNPNNPKKYSKFTYDLIKNKRYTVDKFQLHVPITLNFQAEGVKNINVEVNQLLHETEDVHVIGIDRGERNLLYICVVDSKGKIKEQISLNEIISGKNKDYKVDYHQLLHQKEQDRKKARIEWESIEGIKELKEGYLSQVIHVIAQLMVKYNAIVVLEYLNFGFMRGRQKFEKQVYQKFEKQLIDKLNYLVDKQRGADSLGGLLQAYQLTNKFESFAKMGEQNGFLYYIHAWNTSKMDPITGFVNLFYTKYKNVEESK